MIRRSWGGSTWTGLMMSAAVCCVAPERVAAQFPVAWGTATTGLGVAGSGATSRTGLFEIARVSAAIRVGSDVAFQAGAMETHLLTGSGSSVTDPRAVEPNVAGLTAGVALMTGTPNGWLGSTTSLAVGEFSHKSGPNTTGNHFGVQAAFDGQTFRFPYFGDLSTGALILLIPESGGNTEYAFGLTFGFRFY